MIRLIPFAAVVLFSLSAWAGTSFQSFTWHADSRFVLTLQAGGQAVVLKGDLRDGKAVDVTQDAVSLHITSYDSGESFLSAVITTTYDDMADLYLLAGPQNFSLLGGRVIQGRKATLGSSLEAAMKGLQQMKGWDASISLRKLAEYTAAHPGKKVEDFANEVELKNPEILSVPKPGKTKPAVKQPAVEPPTVEQPTAEQPAGEQPVTQPEGQLPNENQPVFTVPDQSVADGQTGDDPFSPMVEPPPRVKPVIKHHRRPKPVPNDLAPEWQPGDANDPFLPRN